MNPKDYPVSFLFLLLDIVSQYHTVCPKMKQKSHSWRKGLTKPHSIQVNSPAAQSCKELLEIDTHRWNFFWCVQQCSLCCCLFDNFTNHSLVTEWLHIVLPTVCFFGLIIIYSSNDPGSPPNSLFPYILPHTAMPTIHLTWPSTFAPYMTPRPNLPHHLTPGSPQSNITWYPALDKTRPTACMLYHNKPRQRYSLAFFFFIDLTEEQKPRLQHDGQHTFVLFNTWRMENLWKWACSGKYCTSCSHSENKRKFYEPSSYSAKWWWLDEAFIPLQLYC